VKTHLANSAAQVISPDSATAVLGNPGTLRHFSGMKKIATLLLLAATVSTQADNMTSFPPAEPGMVRYVIQLPSVENEDDLKVQLQVGKTVEVDPVNTHFFAGQIQALDIPGRGFTRYVVEDLGPMAGTLMAQPPNAAKIQRFISLGGEPYFIRYNSRLPIVVYVPEGAEVRYRLWQASPTFEAAPKG
jgi:ecotin